MPLDQEFVLTVACRATKGIVHAVSGLLDRAGCNIVDSQQYGDHRGPVPSGKATRLHFQAHTRGVKPISTAAHGVIPGLVEAPIIEHDAKRVAHPLGTEDFAAVGSGIASRVPARAFRRHVDHRVQVNGRQCVVFH